ncbi:hypothetical protein T265_03628 [Opisthorchis viverrini]|uniref:Uncharacterized protein n=1 Tax=Opisthorchis viverrini TaxID=6198 RepID=A0A075AHG3_OPIVI|nr:hypothetical protein T265_03628 [Opisthorchis viverrini]KER29834.1 hypothetical protein T265_03628 [Opisthorchis viverrini]
MEYQYEAYHKEEMISGIESGSGKLDTGRPLDRTRCGLRPTENARCPHYKATAIASACLDQSQYFFKDMVNDPSDAGTHFQCEQHWFVRFTREIDPGKVGSTRNVLFMKT